MPMTTPTRHTTLDYSDLPWVNQMAADLVTLKAERDALLALVQRFNAAMELVRDEESETGGIDQLVDLTTDTLALLARIDKAGAK